MTSYRTSNFGLERPGETPATQPSVYPDIEEDQMAAARLAIAALRIPWKELLKAAPLILRASAELVARLSDRRRGFVDQGEKPADAAAVLLRLDALETSDVAQAQLAKEMAGQLNEVTEALRVVAVRILFALGASGIAVALALTAAIRTLL